MESISISTNKLLDVSNTLIDRSVISKSFDFIGVMDGNIKTASINLPTQQKYIGDFYGLLSYLNVPVVLYYATTLLNGYDHTSDYDGERSEILYINEDITRKILSAFR